MFTAAAVSPESPPGTADLTVVLTAVYAVLLVVEVKLLREVHPRRVVSAMPELAHAPADEKRGPYPARRYPRQARSRRLLAFAY